MLQGANQPGGTGRRTAGWYSSLQRAEPPDATGVSTAGWYRGRAAGRYIQGQNRRALQGTARNAGWYKGQSNAGRYSGQNRRVVQRAEPPGITGDSQKRRVV